MPLSLDDAWSRWKKRRGDENAREVILEAHLGLVKRTLARLRIGLPPDAATRLTDDLSQAGLLGLIQALDHFDPNAGSSFNTFAAFRVRGSMLDELRRQDWLSKGSRHRLKELRKKMTDLEQSLGRTASDEELAQKLGQSVESLRQEYLDLGPATLVFLDGLDRPGEGKQWADYVADPDTLPPDERAQRSEIMEALAHAVGELPEQERLVMTLLLNDELGQKEIAEVLKVSPARISQVHAKAVLHLQMALAPYFEKS